MTPDRINEMMDACAALKRAHVRSSKARENRVVENALGLMTECAELVDETEWKPWKTSFEFNKAAFMAEAADVLHFFFHLMADHDVTADELFLAFMAKNQINYDRLASDY